MSDPEESIATLARDLSATASVDDLMQFAVDAAVRLIDGCGCAAISIIRGRNITTQAATSDLVRRSNELQQELGEGPMFDAFTQDELVTVTDFGHEDRWPAWAHRVRDELGLRSMIGLRLFVGDRTYGTLTLFSDEVDAFTPDDYDDAYALAAQVSAAAAASVNDETLRAALANRVVIGQAQGMLMQRFGVSADQAFAVLARGSQDANRKLTDVCRQVVAEGVDSLPRRDARQADAAERH